MRNLRSAILQQLREQKGRYVVTSCWEGEGKTTVSINLGAALREFGLKVLLVDGDIRQRSLTRVLKLETQAQVVCTESPALPGIGVVPAVETPGIPPSDLLARSEYRSELLEILKNYDVVLADSPPLSVCSDAALLGSWFDGALMVVSQGRFQGVPEGHYSEDLREQGVPILGVVITGATGD